MAQEIIWNSNTVTCNNVSLQFMDIVIALRTGSEMNIAGRAVRVVRIEAEDGSLKSWNIEGYVEGELAKIYWNEIRGRVSFTY